MATARFTLEMYREAVFLWITPWDAARDMARTAMDRVLSASLVFVEAFVMAPREPVLLVKTASIIHAEQVWITNSVWILVTYTPTLS